MSVQKPSIPKGTRDFSPVEMMRRTYIFDTVKSVFRTYGFSPLETPAMENLSTLLGKYGDEGDKLLFRILNSGDCAADITAEEMHNSSALAAKICEKGLRYDLTVPFARYVVQHQNDIVFPFKRYQVQPVWRADRPQKGRYREFYQCDVDIIGSRSLTAEVELVSIVERVFEKLGIRVTLKMNNRKILYGIAETIGHADKMIDITVAIDKMEKIGIEAVEAELEERGIDRTAIGLLRPILQLDGDNMSKLDRLSEIIGGSETGRRGIEEMRTIFEFVSQLGIGLDVELDLSLARGLNYYTGAIFEVKARDFAIGRRRPLRRPYRNIRNARHVGCRHLVRSRPYLRRHVRLEPLPRGDKLDYTCDVRQPRRPGAAGIDAPARYAASSRHRLGDLSRQRQVQETDGVCQPPPDTVRGHRRQRRTRGREGNAQGYA